jgi:G3E family GTPase
MIKIDIIAGFLGAGKTTLIKQLLKDISNKEKIVIIENEIGEVNIDAQDLQDLKVSIKEITSGCICCNLSINLTTILNTIGEEGSVDRIIIEPTGLACLSDLLGIFNYINKDIYQVNLIITILDVHELEFFAGNFGTFFSDQIRKSKTIILSKKDIASDSDIKFAKYYANNLNPSTPVIDTRWDNINIEYLENLIQNTQIAQRKSHQLHEHKQSFDGFDNITLKPKELYSKDNLDLILEEIKSKTHGDIIRIKGFLALDDNTSMKIDYVLGQIYMKKNNLHSENMLVIIGKGLNREKLKTTFK